MRAVISNIVDYQIFQQFQGYANITVKGEVVDWSPEEDLGVYVQILRDLIAAGQRLDCCTDDRKEFFGKRGWGNNGRVVSTPSQIIPKEQR
jgi:hypothetical protein